MKRGKFELVNSSFIFDEYFSEDDINRWIVKYFERDSNIKENVWDRGYGCDIYLNDNLYHEFDTLPRTKTSNPTKTQAKELIIEAIKINKPREDRNNKIENILN